ncbi:MAG: hypothetical protein R2882_06710 [Gemmatimonadales bacterium]
MPRSGIGLIGITGELASALLFLFAPTSIVTWALIPSTFFASFGFARRRRPFRKSPVLMRAQTSAVYLLVVNLIGQTRPAARGGADRLRLR